MAGEPKLTGKQRMFCEHYIACCFNATEAARRAGYADTSDIGLSVRGNELLRNVKVVDYIKQRTAEVAISANEVLLRLARHARGSFEAFIYPEESLPGEAPKLDLSTAAARQNIDLVREIETETTTKISEDAAYETVKTKVKLYDAQAALRDLGRHHKLFTDKQEVGGLNGEPIEIVVRRVAKRIQDDGNI